MLPLPVNSIAFLIYEFLNEMLPLLIRAIPVAFAFAYYFSANTILYFLMRKAEDTIEVDEVYEEKPEEPAAAEAGANAGGQPA